MKMVVHAFITNWYHSCLLQPQDYLPFSSMVTLWAQLQLVSDGMLQNQMEWSLSTSSSVLVVGKCSAALWWAHRPQPHWVDSYHTPATPVTSQLTPVLEEDLQQLPVWLLNKIVSSNEWKVLLYSIMLYISSQWTTSELHYLSHLSYTHSLLVSSFLLST